MVYGIDSTHLNNGHMYPTQLMQILSSDSCVQQLIIPERLYQIYIVAHHWKEEIFSFSTMCQSSNLSLVSNLKGQATIVTRHVSEKVRSESILYLQLVLIDQRKGGMGFFLATSFFLSFCTYRLFFSKLNCNKFLLFFEMNNT